MNRREQAGTVLRSGLSERLHHVRFIGGGSGAGKSTVAARLADEHDFRLYHAEQFSHIAAHSTRSEAPLLHAFMAMDMDQRWVNRSPQSMFETFHGFHGEGFDIVLGDLLALPETPPILVEGFNLLPRLVAPLLHTPHQAVWLLPTPEFRLAAFRSRGSIGEIPNKTSDPERALANLLARDALFTDAVAREAQELGLLTLEVDTGMSIEDLLSRVARALGLTNSTSHRAQGQNI